MSTLLNTWGTIQRQLFPSLESEIGPLSEKEKDLIQMTRSLNIMQLELFREPHLDIMIGSFER